MKQEEEKCCGECCWFYCEMTDGEGICAECPIGNNILHCDSKACDNYVSREQMRHYIAVLLQANRYRRDQNVPSIYRMPNPTELGKAIDFAVEYIKVFNQL